MAGQLVGFDQGLTMSQDGNWHKDVRKVLASVLNPGSVKLLKGMPSELMFKAAKLIRDQACRKRKQPNSCAGCWKIPSAYAGTSDTFPAP